MDLKVKFMGKEIILKYWHSERREKLTFNIKMYYNSTKENLQSVLS